MTRDFVKGVCTRCGQTTYAVSALRSDAAQATSPEERGLMRERGLSPTEDAVVVVLHRDTCSACEA